MQKIAPALVKAQKEFGPALKDKTNPAFRSQYADLGACIEAVIDALNNNGIMLMQPCHEVDNGVTVETLFIHESGETMSAGRLHVPAAKQDPQGYGSALTYARRYSLMAACGIAPEDDDGNAASKPKAGAPAGGTRPKEQPKDNSPRGRATRLIDGVKNGDTVNAASAAATWPEDELNAVWALLPVDVIDKLTAAWPGA